MVPMKIIKDKLLAIIPARGGSKGIPEKNIKKLASRPLIWYPFNAALKANFVSRIVCSTESEKISGVAKSIGLEVINRPNQLAEDETPMEQVIRSTLKTLYELDGAIPEFVARLQPTHPFVMPKHIDEAIQVLTTNAGALSAQTICLVPHRFHAYKQKTLENKYAKALFADLGSTTRQAKPTVYGSGNLVIANSNAIIDGMSHFAEPSIGVPIDSVYALDIDTYEDFIEAEFLIKSKKIAIP